MKQHYMLTLLTLATLLVGSSLSIAVENLPETTRSNAHKTIHNTDKSGKVIRSKSAANIRLVDINNATPEQLKKLPGIGDAEADKIVNGRPYYTKAHLVTRNIINGGIYENIKRKIMAGAYKGVAKK